MLFWKNVIPGPGPPSTVYAIIECPKGTQKKYEISKTTNLLVLDRVLHSSVMYPQDYGFIPGTYALDNDPLDILVITNTATYPKTIVKVKPIGVLLMEDEKGIDEKIISVALGCPYYGHIEDIDELPHHFMAEISEFFRTYKNLEEPSYSEVTDWKGKKNALKIIENCIKRFKDKYGDIATINPS